jgi:hypothetical protein
MAVPLNKSINRENIMSKYLYASLLVLSLCTVNGAVADEVSTTTTKTDNPDSSSTTNSMTTEERPGAVRSESTTTDSTPYGQQVTTKKSYKRNPYTQRTTTRESETTVNR